MKSLVISVLFCVSGRRNVNVKKSWNTLTALALAVLISLFQAAAPLQVQATGETLSCGLSC